MLLSFALVLLLRYLVLALAIPKSNFTDESALLAFKSLIVSDPSDTITKNWSTATSFCHWRGVTCGDRHQRVVALDLSNMNLKASIPPQLGNLSFLVYLNLTNNTFINGLPHELGHLRRLKVLRLVNCSLTGTVPQSLFNVSTLEGLYLQNNLLQGKILDHVNNLSRLQILALESNLFSGAIASTLFNMSYLRMVSIPANNFSGILQENLCDPGRSKLEWLDLGRNQLHGQIPLDLYKCTELNVLGLDTNNFGGSIPREIGNLTKLTMLYLGVNNLTGEIPREIARLVNLEILDLEKNNLRGTVIREIGQLMSLSILYLHTNFITGSIPREIGNCTMLQEVWIGNNNLTGTIPPEIGNLNNLQFLHLAYNEINGIIPSTISNLSMITVIDLTSNHMSGPLPTKLGLWLPILESLFLSENGFTGPIPDSLSNASYLINIDLSTNIFSGPIPDSIGNSGNLEYLGLGNNFLTSKELSFLPSLTNCRNLLTISLDNNPLASSLPVSVGNLSASLQYFLAPNCKLKGEIPRGIDNLSNLIELDLKDNLLTGTIAMAFGKLKFLQSLSLQDNNLQGSLPNQLCHLERLAYLYVANNNLSGPIAACLGNLQSLRVVSLAFNRFNATISPALWSLSDVLLVNLSSNSLTGSISSDIGNLKVATQIDLSRNQLSGNIPSSISGLQNLFYLSLSDNILQGPIPNSFGELVALSSLDLSRNNLSGGIPMSLEKLKYLRNFNVSFNQLLGEIPSEGPFANFSAQSFLGNPALCGSTRLRVPPCKNSTHPQSKRHILIVLKYVLPAVASIVLLLVILVVFTRYRNQKSKLPIQADFLPLATWRRISYRELELATGGFEESNLLGTGSFGSVYKGTLSDGTNVAVKVFKLQPDGVFTSFDTECEIFRNLRHRNLVRIISGCSNLDFKALVLEFMPNWSLEKWLYSHNYFLDILQRLNIMIDVATALEYLHHGYSTPVVHCDLKPSNVLLDANMVAHVSDFGIAKLLGEGDSMTQTLTLATIGYMAPEYGREGIVSIKGDIYSYGILLMETLTRKRPTDEMFTGEMSMKHWVKQFLPHQVTRVADSNILKEGDEHFSAKKHCISSILELASQCSAGFPEQRMDITDVLAALIKIKTKFVKECSVSTRHVPVHNI